MSSAYRHVTLSEVKPGMVLSDELLDKHGKVLLPKGAILTTKTIALLPNHGVEALAVLSSGDADVRPLDHSVVEARLDKLFRQNDSSDANDWATGLLRRYMTDYRTGKGIEP